MRHRFMLALASCALASFLVGSAMAQQPAHPGHTTTTPTESQTTLSKELPFKSSNLSGLNVFNSKSEKLGSLDNLIIDAHTGQVLFGILDTGIGGNKIPVPWSAVRLAKRDNNFVLLLNMDKGHLASAPTFNDRNMSVFTDARWRQSVDKFFGVRTAARVIEEQKSQK